MKKSKFEKLTVEVSQLIDNLNITKKEFRDWVYFCMKKKFSSRAVSGVLEDEYQQGHKLYLINTKVCQFIDDNSIVKKEFCRWAFPFMRRKFPPELIPTPLKIVYKRGQALYVKDGLDKTDKNPIYGVLFPNDLMLSIRPRQRDWRGAKDKAMSLRWGRKKGSLPTAEEFANQTKNQNKKFTETLAIVSSNYPEVYSKCCIWTSTSTGPYLICDRYQGIICYSVVRDDNSDYYFAKGTADDFFKKHQLLAILF